MDPTFLFGGNPFSRLSQAEDAAESIFTGPCSSLYLVIIPTEEAVETDEEEVDDDATEIVSTDDVWGCVI